MPQTLPQPATLLVKLHGHDSRQVELSNETLTIGRKADNTLVIEDPAVSGHHARIVKVQFHAPDVRIVFIYDGRIDEVAQDLGAREMSRVEYQCISRD